MNELRPRQGNVMISDYPLPGLSRSCLPFLIKVVAQEEVCLGQFVRAWGRIVAAEVRRRAFRPVLPRNSASLRGRLQFWSFFRQLSWAVIAYQFGRLGAFPGCK